MSVLKPYRRLLAAGLAGVLGASGQTEGWSGTWTCATVSGGDSEFGAGAVGELADGRLAPPGGEGSGELADVVLGPGGLHTGEDVDGAITQLETVVQVAGLEMGGPHDREPHT